MPRSASTLSLVPPATSPATSPSRPWRTHYYASKSDISAWSAIGCAASLRGATRSAFLRILDGRGNYAVVHDPSGAPTVYLTRKGNGVEVIGYFGASL